MNTHILDGALFIALLAGYTADTMAFDVNNPDEWPVKPASYGLTADSYVQTESYAFMGTFIKRSGVNNFFHFKTLATAEDKWVVSPNNDVLYSVATVDASEGFTLVLPVAK